MFKLTHGLYDDQVTENIIEFKTSQTRGHQYTLSKPRFNYDIRKYSFRNRVVDQWNSLPQKVVESESIACFERRLDKVWMGSPVMFDPEANLLLCTNSSRSIRMAHQHTTDDHDDLSPEAI